MKRIWPCRYRLNTIFANDFCELRHLAERQRQFSTPSNQGAKLRVAVVGSGPAGFYTAYRILEKVPPGVATVDMYEKLPVPYGLARFGVAPDHPEVKNCQEKFEEVAQSPYFTFVGNTMVGAQPLAVPKQTPSFIPNHIPISLLRKHYDAIVLSYGADSDKNLSSSVRGLNLTGVYSARAFVGWYNGHPEFQDLDPDVLAGEEAVVVGHGNVALDVARILLTDVDVLRKTDITEAALVKLSENKVNRVRIVGRRGPAQASFTNKEVRELMTLNGVGFIPLDEEFLSPFLVNSAKLARTTKRLLQLLQKGSTTPTADAKKHFSFDFLLSPASFEALEGSSHVASARFDVMELQGDKLSKDTRVKRTGEVTELPCNVGFMSVGYKTHPLAGLEDIYSDSANHVNNEAGKVTGDGMDTKGLYSAGWIKRGPAGVIAETMYDSFETAAVILNDFEVGEIGGSSCDGWEGVKADLGDELDWKVVSWSDWQKIDNAEKERGSKIGKEREKFTNQNDMLAVLE
ncbi:hypothetical protein POJ06DRAFT_134660 [Lipomyces tetrasporus]|uniref:NADPH:adrenodoxin oxidoreductase, mitochondrial n=1 Tax=Lipomyces tetrasporus TaxID=54092 RepID=A0AAD7VSV2_9ASCO|nr:uncharacterized protein POJ06DRAFT_134660 [Lipomyces tetrasporus]KAJ8099415.1 hypothetical protein POJ06DRAFT_134660 [Lipomyces tetrasporus]